MTADIGPRKTGLATRPSRPLTVLTVLTVLVWRHNPLDHTPFRHPDNHRALVETKFETSKSRFLQACWSFENGLDHSSTIAQARFARARSFFRRRVSLTVPLWARNCLAPFFEDKNKKSKYLGKDLRAVP